MSRVDRQCQVLRCPNGADDVYAFRLAGRIVETTVCGEHAAQLETDVSRDWDEEARRILLGTDAHPRLLSFTVRETIEGEVLTLGVGRGTLESEVKVHLSEYEVGLLGSLFARRAP